MNHNINSGARHQLHNPPPMSHARDGRGVAPNQKLPPLRAPFPQRATVEVNTGFAGHAGSWKTAPTAGVDAALQTWRSAQRHATRTRIRGPEHTLHIPLIIGRKTLIIGTAQGRLKERRWKRPPEVSW